MKLSKLIKKLQEDFEIHGDIDVVYMCDCFDCDCFDYPVNGHYDIGGIGWYADSAKDERKIELICSECHANAVDDHIRGKYG